MSCPVPPAHNKCPDGVRLSSISDRNGVYDHIWLFLRRKTLIMSLVGTGIWKLSAAFPGEAFVDVHASANTSTGCRTFFPAAKGACSLARLAAVPISLFCVRVCFSSTRWLETCSGFLLVSVPRPFTLVLSPVVQLLIQFADGCDRRRLGPANWLGLPACECHYQHL